MTREIKFRAWDDGKMVYEKDIKHILLENDEVLKLARFFCNIRNDSKLMQYTGLKDKNGKEIYEGDVIGKSDVRNPLEMIWGAIVYVAPSFQVTVSPSQSCLYTKEWIQECIVLGNIYENPELLNK